MDGGLTLTNQTRRSALNFIIFIIIALGVTVFTLNEAKRTIQKLNDLANTALLQQYNE